ncbi:MAG: hypothetical protein AAF721_11885 [Myxococcota bacterium]
MARIVVSPLDIGTGAPAAAGADAPPTVQTLALSFGVGARRDAAPTNDEFRETYHLTIPIFSLGGLDPDGVYEFDAAGLLSTLGKQATRRVWGVRLQLELIQQAAAAGHATLAVDAPSETGGLRVLGGDSGESLPGGGRRIVVASDVVTNAASVAEALEGTYRIATSVGGTQSSEQTIRVALGRFEFQD